MGLVEDLSRLDELHARGALTDEEFQRAKARLVDGPPPGSEAPAMAALNRLRRSRSDRWIAGVCGGVAAMTGVESWIWRLILAVLALFGGTGVVLYILLWIFVPDE